MNVSNNPNTPENIELGKGSFQINHNDRNIEVSRLKIFQLLKKEGFSFVEAAKTAVFEGRGKHVEVPYRSSTEGKTGALYANALNLTTKEYDTASGERAAQYMNQNKEALQTFQQSENRIDETMRGWTNVERFAEEDHLSGAIDSLKEKVTEGSHVPIILGAMELRFSEVKEGDVTTKGIIENFGSIHQPEAFAKDPLQQQIDAHSPREKVAKGHGGVLETRDWSMIYNIVAVLVPSVYIQGSLHYAREGDEAQKIEAGTSKAINPWEKGITKEGRLTLDKLYETNPNLPMGGRGLPNVKAKELFFLLSVGYKPEFIKVGGGDHRQLTFVPPGREEFESKFPQALEKLSAFSQQKIFNNPPSSDPDEVKKIEEAQEAFKAMLGDLLAP